MLQTIAAYTILGLTVGISIGRPKIGRFHLHHSAGGVIGAALTVALGIVPPAAVLDGLQMLALPVITIVSLMAITLIADEAGLFRIAAGAIVEKAGGSGLRLFGLLFLSGTLTGTFFTNDAAVLIFTPLVFNLIEDVKGDSWTIDNKLPYYFGVLYVANLVGALVIANPINIVVASILGIGFVEYARWMILPALASMVVSFFGLLVFFRKSIPETYERPKSRGVPLESRPFVQMCAAVLFLTTLVGFFIEGVSGIPIWLVAMAGAAVLCVARSVFMRASLVPLVRGIGWDVIVFVIGIFIVAMGLREVGLAERIASMLSGFGGSFYQLVFATGFMAAASSAIIDNHPTADMMAWVVHEMPLADLQRKLLACAALIGGDLGPKMSPIGSLAALMWLRLLRDRGVDIPYRMFLRINVPVTLAAVLVATAVLCAEIALFADLP